MASASIEIVRTKHSAIDEQARSPVANTAAGQGACRLERKPMLGWSLSFLIIALLAGLLGFAGIAGTAAWIAKLLFLLFLVLFVLSLIFGRTTRV